MAFGKRQNNYSDLTTNTNGFQFYNIESSDPSTLQLNYWNGLLALKICPALPENKRGDSKKYDYDTFITCILTAQKAYDLYRVASTEFYEAYRKNPETVKSVGVPSGDGFLQISNGINIPDYKISGEIPIVLTIYKDIDSSAKTDSFISYEFRKGSIIRNYSNVNGEFEDDRTVDSEFSTFLLYLKEGSKALTEAFAHSVRYSDRFYRAKEISNSQKIMSALNIETDGRGYKRVSDESPFSRRGREDNRESRTPAQIEDSTIQDIYNELES